MIEPITVMRPERVHNNLYKFVGAGILMLNKLRHYLRGYTTARTFSITDYQKATDYDIKVIENWLLYLSKYLHRRFDIRNKVILELGPGADLGVGLYLLYKGASQYNAVDVFNLVESVPPDFYGCFFQRLKKLDEPSEVSLDFLRSQLELTRQRNNDRLNYICCEDFSLSVFAKKSIDLVVSQAAFEHFDDVEKTVSQLSEVTKSGGILVAEIDLRTHSRWIRGEDPLNIYRYGDSFYNLCGFRGFPNRLRPCQYKEIFRKNGWDNVWIMPIIFLDEGYLTRVRSSLSKKFHDENNQMSYISIILCATKR